MNCISVWDGSDRSMSCSGLQTKRRNAFDGKSLQWPLHHWMVSLWSPGSITQCAISRSQDPCYVHMCVPWPMLIRYFFDHNNLSCHSSTNQFESASWQCAWCHLWGGHWPAGLASLKGIRGFWIWASNWSIGGSSHAWLMLFNFGSAAPCAPMQSAVSGPRSKQNVCTEKVCDFVSRTSFWTMCPVGNSAMIKSKKILSWFNDRMLSAGRSLWVYEMLVAKALAKVFQTWKPVIDSGWPNSISFSNPSSMFLGARIGFAVWESDSLIMLVEQHGVQMFRKIVFSHCLQGILHCTGMFLSSLSWWPQQLSKKDHITRYFRQCGIHEAAWWCCGNLGIRTPELSTSNLALLGQNTGHVLNHSMHVHATVIMYIFFI